MERERRELNHTDFVNEVAHLKGNKKEIKEYLLNVDNAFRKWWLSDEHIEYYEENGKYVVKFEGKKLIYRR